MTPPFHSCNVLCTNEIHVDVVYTTWHPDERGAAGPRGFVALDVEGAVRRRWPGMHVIDSQPAREALPVDVASTLPTYGYLRHGDREPQYAWLIWWKERERG